MAKKSASILSKGVSKSGKKGWEKGRPLTNAAEEEDGGDESDGVEHLLDLASKADEEACAGERNEETDDIEQRKDCRERVRREISVSGGWVAWAYYMYSPVERTRQISKDKEDGA